MVAVWMKRWKVWRVVVLEDAVQVLLWGCWMRGRRV